MLRQHFWKRLPNKEVDIYGGVGMVTGVGSSFDIPAGECGMEEVGVVAHSVNMIQSPDYNHTTFA